MGHILHEVTYRFINIGCPGNVVRNPLLQVPRAFFISKPNEIRIRLATRMQIYIHSRCCYRWAGMKARARFPLEIWIYKVLVNTGPRLFSLESCVPRASIISVIKIKYWAFARAKGTLVLESCHKWIRLWQEITKPLGLLNRSPRADNLLRFRNIVILNSRMSIAYDWLFLIIW